jgi:hypothetical protein
MGDMLDVIQVYLLKRSFGETEMLEAEDKARARITRLLSGESLEDDPYAAPHSGAVETETEEGETLLTYPGLGPPLE